jgi:hypothetical protein
MLPDNNTVLGKALHREFNLLVAELQIPEEDAWRRAEAGRAAFAVVRWG